MNKQLRGRPRGFDPDSVINDVMIEFWKHGYDNVSMDSLCKLTKLSKPSFYNAFENKEKLFSICLKRYHEKYSSPLLGQLLSDSNPIHGYEKMLLAASKQFQDPSVPTGCLILTGAIEAKGKTKAIDKELTYLQNTMLNEFANYFSKHVSRTSKGSSQAIAQFVLSQLYALAMFSRTNMKSINFNEFIKTSKHLLQVLLK